MSTNESVGVEELEVKIIKIVTNKLIVDGLINWVPQEGRSRHAKRRLLIRSRKWNRADDHRDVGESASDDIMSQCTHDVIVSVD
jgi:hypothetical protein